MVRFPSGYLHDNHQHACRWFTRRVYRLVLLVRCSTTCSRWTSEKEQRRNAFVRFSYLVRWHLPERTDQRANSTLTGGKEIDWVRAVERAQVSDTFTGRQRWTSGDRVWAVEHPFDHSTRTVRTEEVSSFNPGSILFSTSSCFSSLSNRSYFVREYTFSWSSPNYRSRFHDKIHLADTGYWYGGATQRTVYWPINQFVTRRQAVIPQDAYKYRINLSFRWCKLSNVSFFKEYVR